MTFLHYLLTFLKYSLDSSGEGFMVGESGFQLAGQTGKNKILPIRIWNWVNWWLKTLQINNYDFSDGLTLNIRIYLKNKYCWDICEIKWLFMAGIVVAVKQS